jgi:putative tricarboxylic transport membrane protein
MTIDITRRRLVATAAALPCLPARAQGWQPARAIEYVVPSGPGAALDASARQLRELLDRRRLVPQGMIVTNRPGGAGAIAINTLLSQAGNPHFVTTYTHSMLNSRLLGELPVSWRELTPVAILFEEAICAVVRTESPIANAQDLVRRLRADPAGVTIGIATAAGNHIHVAIAKPLKAAGVDVSKLTVVPFKSSAESMTAMLGGHIDMISASAPNLGVQLAAGRIRPLAVASAERLAGPLAGVPTWRELGVPADYSSAQGVLAPKGLSAEQLEWWTSSLRAVTESEEWKDFLAKQNWKPRFMAQAEMIRYLESEEAAARVLLTDLGLIRKQ